MNTKLINTTNNHINNTGCSQPEAWKDKTVSILVIQAIKQFKFVANVVYQSSNPAILYLAHHTANYYVADCSIIDANTMQLTGDTVPVLASELGEAIDYWGE